MKNSKKFLDVLIDIRFYDSINKFEEIYGEGVSYRKMEQDTYVELKSMTLELLGRKIKYKKCKRKHSMKYSMNTKDERECQIPPPKKGLINNKKSLRQDDHDVSYTMIRRAFVRCALIFSIYSLSRLQYFFF